MDRALLLSLTLLLSTFSLIGALNITSVLDNSNCKQFLSLITDTGVLNSYLTAEKGRGLTLFAPSDDAFKEQKTPDLNKLTNAELVSFLDYHAIPIYAPKETLKNMTKNPIKTLASGSIGKFELTVRIDGEGNLMVETGVDVGKVVSTAGDEAPVCVFVLDRILIPVEIYGNATVPGPAPAPDVPEAKVPSPKKSGAGEVEAAGIIREILFAVSLTVVVLFF